MNQGHSSYRTLNAYEAVLHVRPSFLPVLVYRDGKQYGHLTTTVSTFCMVKVNQTIVDVTFVHMLRKAGSYLESNS